MYHQRHRLISDIRRDGLRVWGDTFDKVLLDKPDRARQGAATR
jgi:hypothetical protein